MEALLRRAQVGRDVGQRRVRQLVRQGALLEQQGQLQRPEELRPIGRLYALEAKTDDWSGGLGQAVRYGSWADAAGVVVAKLPRDPSRAVAQASGLGIGLALGTRWLVRPRVRRLEEARRLWASEHVVASLRDAPSKHHHNPSALA